MPAISNILIQVKAVLFDLDGTLVDTTVGTHSPPLVLNHPLIFLIMKSMPYRSKATGCYLHNRFMVVAFDSFPMTTTAYRPTFNKRCHRTSHPEASRSKNEGIPEARCSCDWAITDQGSTFTDISRHILS
jgi:FMN phosphatase YigB (HAD superfamily)